MESGALTPGDIIDHKRSQAISRRLHERDALSARLNANARCKNARTYIKLADPGINSGKEEIVSDLFSQPGIDGGKGLNITEQTIPVQVKDPKAVTTCGRRLL